MSDRVRSYDHLISFALEHPWALTDAMRGVVASILARRIAGHDVDPAEIAAAAVSRKNLPQPTRGPVALIPIYGVIAPRMNLLSDMSGGTTFEALTHQLQAALDNPDVKTIIFDVDSPGGNVAGATEFAAAVLKARTQKPIIAQANYLMASAAYWPMACATQLVAAPSAMVGSIGVVAMHEDISEALAKAGVKRETFVAGKYKAEGMDGGPLSDEAKAHLKALVDTAYARQVKDIASGRGVSVASVRGGFGEGRCLSAEDALGLGMIDRVATLDETLARALGSRAPTALPRATDQELPLAATSQELAADALWQNAITDGLLSLDL